MTASKLNAVLLCVGISVGTLWAGTDLTMRYVAPMMQRQIQTAASEVYGWAGNSWWHNRTPDPGDLSWQGRLYLWVRGVPKGNPCPHPSTVYRYMGDMPLRVGCLGARTQTHSLYEFAT